MYTGHFVQNPQHLPPIYASYNQIQDSSTINNLSSLNFALDQRRRDTEFFDTFINSCIKKSQEKKRKRIGISETRDLILPIKNLNISLEKSANLLKENRNNCHFNWEIELEKCENLKKQINSLLTKLKENEAICKFQKLVERRKKKRLREKRKRDEWKIQKNLREERRRKLHNEIDNWIRIKQEAIEREKQELNLKRDADLVLSEVRGKRSDAKKYLNILRELQNLRRVKASNARSRGENLSTAADESFERIITQLIEQWSELDREYSIEEHGLKLMLKSDNEKKIARKKKSSFDDWEFAIFGRTLFNESKDFNDLLITRYAWDRYINYNGTRIPVGWVMPKPPTSAAWQKCLKK